MDRFTFEAQVIQWRGPAPYFFAAIPAEVADKISRLRKVFSYGWGVIPVTVSIQSVPFCTSLFPKDGGYLLPLKDAVRKKLAIPEDGVLQIVLTLGRSE
ncbi:DUF1905 domain-containing protein [Devosia soli]|nr:DUF1905 domain-containing protein [Devosia soli]